MTKNENPESPVMQILVPGLAQQPASVAMKIPTPSLASDPAYVLSLDQVLIALKKSGTQKQFCEMQPDELETVLILQGLQVSHGDTKAIAAVHHAEHQTILKRVSQYGSLYGLHPTRLPSRKYDWLLIRMTKDMSKAEFNDMKESSYGR